MATQPAPRANDTGRAASGSVGARSSGPGARASTERRKSVSIDDDVEGAVPEHKLHLVDSEDVERKKVNPIRKHLKPKSPGVQDSAAFTYEPIEALDAGDPNYDVADHADDGSVDLEPTEPEHLAPELRKPLELLVQEFFNSGECDDFRESMLELDPSDHARIAAMVVAVEMGLARKDSERELVSRLLLHLTATHTVSERQAVRAFDTLLANMADLALDHPEAGQLVAYFIGRAIADDVLHPSFVATRRDVTDPRAADVIRTAAALINMRHGLARLDSVWKGGACRGSLTALVDQVHGMLKEYVEGGDLREAERQIRQWAVPHFHHEVVFDSLVMALEFGNAKGKDSQAKISALTKLLATFADTNLISDEQMQLGHDRVLKGLHDLVVDIPTAKRDIVGLVQQGVAAGYLLQEFLAKATEAVAAQ